MPKCCVKGCSSKYSKKVPPISLHKLPINKSSRRKWLNMIGSDNLRSNTKAIFVCSMHFEESCFNRTLDVVRLRDDSVPSLYLPPYNGVKPATSLSEISRQIIRSVSNFEASEPEYLDEESDDSTSSDIPCVAPIPPTATHKKDEEATTMAPKTINAAGAPGILRTYHTTPSIQPSTSSRQERSNQKLSNASHILIQEQSLKIQKLLKVCTLQRKKIKRLFETIRRRNKKIEELNDILVKKKVLKLANKKRKEEPLTSDDSASPKDAYLLVVVDR